MKKLRRFLAFVLCAALCFLLLTGCGSRDTIRFKMIAELNQEEFCVAFRKGDPLCDIFTAALKELSADGQISRLSAQYLGTDYTCMEALPGALQLLETQPEPGRKLRIGVQDGIAPISSSRDDGSFGGLIPDLAQLVAEKLGWTFEYMVINSDNVAAELGSGNIDCAWMAASFSGSSSSVSLSPGWLRNTHELVVRSDSRYTRKNSLKGKVIGITDATALAALKESGMDAKVGSVWYYDDLSVCFAALAAGDCDAVVIDGIVSGYYMFSSENVRVKFRVPLFMVSDIIDTFGTDIRFSEQDEENVTVSTVTNEMSMEQFARSYAPHVTILEPQALRDKVKSDFQAALAKYE